MNNVTSSSLCYGFVMVVMCSSGIDTRACMVAANTHPKILQRRVGAPAGHCSACLTRAGIES